MACARLEQLPVELLRNIVLRLPSSAALAFTLICRYIYAACNDWATWRDLLAAQHTLADSYHAILSRHPTPSTWKRYIIADALASRRQPLDRRDVEGWLPHMVVMHHPVVQYADTVLLHYLCDTVCNAPIPTRSTGNDPSQVVLTSATSATCPGDTHTWRLAQAAGFCLSAKLLARRAPSGEAKPPCLLQSVQWFPLTEYLRHGTDTRDPQRQLAVMHALANRVVGFFYRELCWALANNATCSGSTAGLLQPPTIFSLPLSTLCRPPAPFASDGLEQFSTCHLPSMTEPSFFVDDEWTGYSSLNVGSQIRFDGVGGDNSDVTRNRLNEFPNSHFPFQVERVIRFHMVKESDNGNKYLLQSNYFHMQASLHALRITVDKESGHLKIAHNNLFHSNWPVRDAVITPFGIVEAVHPPGYWTWLWKRKWSNSDL